MGLARFFSWVRFWTSRSTPKTPFRRHAKLTLETLESREVLTLNPTGYEQEMLELLNRMRMDPAGELRRLLTSTNPIQSADQDVQAALQYFHVSGSTLASQWASLTPAQPLAWSEGLMNSSRAHNQAMIAADQQSHQLPGEASLGARMTQGGYANWTTGGENIYAFATSVGYAHAGFAIDWGYGTGGIQSPAGHRVNMMNRNFREVGISVLQENNAATEVGPYVVTQDFGNRSNFGNAFVLGVTYNDADHDHRYDAGEGLGNVSVTLTGTAGTFHTQTMTAGGYQLQVPAGTYTLTFSGDSLGAAITKSVTVGSANVKMDALAGTGSSSGTGGSGSGGGSGTATNHAPLLNAGYVAVLTSIPEDSTNPAGNTVATIVGPSITDADASALRGMAVVAAPTTRGVWQYSLNNGNTWNTLTASATAARLLRDTDRIRFIPNANFNGTVNLTYRAWDRTTGSAGSTVNLSTAANVGGNTAYSAAMDAAALIITPVNDAPVLNVAGGFNLASVDRTGRIANSGTLVSTLLSNAVADVDANAQQGLAVVGLTGAGQGAWQYSLDGGKTWLNLGVVSSASARLLRPTDRIRFVPNAIFTGKVSLQFRAWDQSTGTAGGTANLLSRWGALVGSSTAYSANVGTGWLTVA
jgi:uncharacterized protein YkwD